MDVRNARGLMGHLGKIQVSVLGSKHSDERCILMTSSRATSRSIVTHPRRRRRKLLRVHKPSQLETMAQPMLNVTRGGTYSSGAGVPAS
jgi:hypothetical protein